MTLPALFDGLRLPAIVAPMFLTSGPDLVVETCKAGLVGTFPALNQRTTDGFAAWLDEIQARLAGHPGAAPYGVNLIVHKSNARLQADLDVVVRHRVPLVITAFGADPAVIEAVHSYGGLVFHDVISRRHAQKVAEAGVDGIIGLCAGAGGHTGTLSPFAMLAEIRAVFDGPVVLAGAMSSGADIAAARAMGADLAYLGTRFIATQEASVSEAQKAMMLEAGAADVLATRNITGALASFLRPSLLSLGMDPDNLPDRSTGPDVENRGRAWKDIWSAGHGVGSVQDVPTVAALCDRLATEYRATVARMAADPFAAHPAPLATAPVIAGNPMAALHDLGDGVACFRAQTKMNTFDPAVFDLLEETLDRAGRDFTALVLANDDPRAFSAGADLGFFLRMLDGPDGPARIGAYGTRGQQLFVRMMRAPVPVVAAVHGFALGGGCEFQMHADATVAHAGANIGLPETGVGLVPGWGGCTRLYARALLADPLASPVDLAKRAFDTLFAGTIHASAAEARASGLLRPTDGIVADRAGLTAAAKARALALVPGYRPPQPLTLPVAGPSGRDAVLAGPRADLAAGRLSAHDLTLAEALANILTGGPAPGPTVTEAAMMALEVETLARLVVWPPARARIDHMLQTGKRLRN